MCRQGNTYWLLRQLLLRQLQLLDSCDGGDDDGNCVPECWAKGRVLVCSLLPSNGHRLRRDACRDGDEGALRQMVPDAVRGVGG